MYITNKRVRVWKKKRSSFIKTIINVKEVYRRGRKKAKPLIKIFFYPIQGGEKHLHKIHSKCALVVKMS